MTQLNTWAKAWGAAWGSAWGTTEEGQKSGVQRLWMYQLYAEAIEEDRKKREPVAAPANKPQTAVKQPKITKKRLAKRAPAPIEHYAPYTPLPLFTRYSLKESVSNAIQKLLSDLPKLKAVHVPPKVVQISSVPKDKKKRDNNNSEEELLLLLAA